ncbi:hypothetical protein BC938DRAFT_477141, partial [Jimgerdemannia flammicorona]
AIRIAGDVKEDVYLATVRVKHLYLKVAHRPNKDSTLCLYLVDQPTEDLRIRFGHVPFGFVTPQLPVNPDLPFGFIETLTTGLEPSLDRVTYDLVDLGEGELSGRPTTKPSVAVPTAKSLTLNERNKARLEDALEVALETIRIFDWEIDMKFRFGQIYLIDYKQPKKDIPRKHLSIDQVADREFIDKRFASALAPWKENLTPFYQYLRLNDILEEDDSPITEFAIDAQISVNPPDPPANGSQQPQQKHGRLAPMTFNTRITCGFKKDGKVGLWRCAMDKEDLFVASMFNAERKYAWELKLSTGRRADPEMLPPVKEFIEGLRLGKQDRLVYTKVPNVKVTRVCQKTIQRYDWEKHNFIIEVCRDEVWNDRLLPAVPVIKNVEVRLSAEPNEVVYKVS